MPERIRVREKARKNNQNMRDFKISPPALWISHSRVVHLLKVRLQHLLDVVDFTKGDICLRKLP